MAKATIDTTPESVATGTVTPVFVALVWLGTTMYATHATITGNAENVARPIAAALPGVIAATLLTSASIAAAAGSRLRTAGGRLFAGVCLGALFGLAAAAGIRYMHSGGATIMVLAITVGAAGLVGGGLAVLPTDVLKSGLWGTTWVFLVGVIFEALQPELLKLIGRDEAASTRFVVGQSLVAGLAAALCTLRFLRLDRRWVLRYLVGGALPGLLLLGAELLTRAGGSAAAQLVHGFPTDSPALVGLSGSARLRYAILVLAVGGLIAMLVGASTWLLSWPRRRRKQSSLATFHQVLARTGLVVGEQYGFAVAGSYAVQAAGLLQRPTGDIDLFTDWERRGDFETAARAIVDAYRSSGLSVDAERRHDTFTRLTVCDGVHTATVDLGVDVRAHEPVRTPIGPVLHPDDAIANKVRALYERAHACDFIDVDAVLRSGRYERSMILRLAAHTDITFDTRVFADALGQAQRLPASDFAPYGLVGEDLDGLRQRFARWRAELLDTAGSTT
jgi:hypothetical protein